MSTSEFEYSAFTFDFLVSFFIYGEPLHFHLMFLKFYKEREREFVCVSIVSRSLDWNIEVNLVFHLRFEHLIIFTKNSSLENNFPRALIWLTLWVNRVYIWLMFYFGFSLKILNLWVNVPNLVLFTSITPSWIIWRMSLISFAV